MTAQSYPIAGNVSILSRLKDLTRTDHESVERHVSPYFQDFQTYRRLLERFLGFFRPVEAALRQVRGITGIIPDLAERRRSGLLETDLAALGLSAGAIGALPDCTDLPPLETVAQALGCLYVLEGSRLGGQVLAREIVKLGIVPEARAFFLSQGGNVGLLWKQFAAAAEAYHAANPEQSDAICDSARETFRRLEAWLGSRRSDG